jgi:hypothetical protein
MRPAGKRLMGWLCAMWRGLRDWCGDSAYDTYAACAAKRSSLPELSPGEFYVAQMERKYSRPNRCC